MTEPASPPPPANENPAVEESAASSPEQAAVSVQGEAPAAPRAPRRPPPGRSSEKLGFFAKIREEWSLLVLAALFTTVVWYLARENVIGKYTIEKVPVLTTQAELDPEIGVVLRTLVVDIPLECSKQTKLDIEERIRINGGIELKIGEPPATEQRVINSERGDDYVYPFGSQYVRKSELALPEGRVVRRKLRPIRIKEPALPTEELKKRGLTATILRINPDQIKEIVPKSLFGEGEIALTPDPLSLKDLGIDAETNTFDESVRPIALSFEGWRKGTSEAGRDERGLLLTKLEQNVRAQIRIARADKRAVSNTYWFLLDPGVTATFSVEPSDQLMQEDDESGFKPFQKEFTGKILGTSTDHALLDGIRSDWGWAIVFDEEALGRINDAMVAPDKDKNLSFYVRGSIRLVLMGKLARLPLTFEPDESEPLTVQFKRRGS